MYIPTPKQVGKSRKRTGAAKRPKKTQRLPKAEPLIYGTKTVGLVIVPFRIVDTNCSFRFDKRWWTKLNWKSGRDDSGETDEIECDQHVGVFLDELSEDDIRYIVNFKNRKPESET